jgi:hypothetical protein
MRRIEDTIEVYWSKTEVEYDKNLCRTLYKLEGELSNGQEKNFERIDAVRQSPESGSDDLYEAG